MRIASFAMTDFPLPAAPEIRTTWLDSRCSMTCCTRPPRSKWRLPILERILSNMGAEWSFNARKYLLFAASERGMALLQLLGQITEPITACARHPFSDFAKQSVPRGIRCTDRILFIRRVGEEVLNRRLRVPGRTVQVQAQYV